MSTIITIGGVVVNAQWGWSINLRSYQRGSMTLTINPNQDGTEPSIALGDAVVVTNNGTRVFEGLVKTMEIYDGTNLANGYRCYYLTCGDYNALADKRRVAAVVEGVTAEDAITDYILPILAAEGVTAGTIDATFTITLISALLLFRTLCGISPPNGAARTPSRRRRSCSAHGRCTR